MANVTRDLSEMRTALEEAGVTDGTWHLDGVYLHQGPCLVWKGDAWVAAFSERSQFDVEFRESDTQRAVARFVQWVRESEASTQRRSEATERGRKRTG
jgi:hypothetical protein